MINESITFVMQHIINPVALCIFIVIFISCLLLHFRQHFEFGCCRNTRPRSASILSNSSSKHAKETEIEILLYKLHNLVKCFGFILHSDFQWLSLNKTQITLGMSKNIYIRWWWKFWFFPYLIFMVFNLFNNINFIDID